MFVTVVGHPFRFYVPHPLFQRDRQRSNTRSMACHTVSSALDIADLGKVPKLQSLYSYEPHRWSAVCSPVRMRISVVLPLPLAPIKPHLFAFLHGKGHIAQYLIDAEAFLYMLSTDIRIMSRRPLIGQALSFQQYITFVNGTRAYGHYTERRRWCKIEGE